MNKLTESNCNEPTRARARLGLVVLAHATFRDRRHALLVRQARVVQPQDRDVGQAAAAGQLFKAVDITQNARDRDGLQRDGGRVREARHGVGRFGRGHGGEVFGASSLEASEGETEGRNLLGGSTEFRASG